MFSAVLFINSQLQLNQFTAFQTIQIFFLSNAYYQYFINCDKPMIYWSYFLPSGFYFQPLIHPIAGTSTTLPQEIIDSHSASEGLKEKIQIPNFTLNLSVEDLMKAGYENNKTPWTQQQDQKLRILRDNQQLDWTQLAKLMPGRNSKMCYSRYRRLENNTKQSWKNSEDKLLMELVQTNGQNWKQICKHFPKRTLKQVKEHYLNYLRPQIKKDEWTLQQDLKLVQQINQFGKNWKIIQQNFQGRTQNQIKNRFFGRLKRLAQKKALSKQKSFAQSKNRRED